MNRICLTYRVGTNDGPFEDDSEPSDSLFAEGLFALYKDPRHEVGSSGHSLQVNFRKNDF